jgi:hypothetical protein
VKWYGKYVGNINWNVKRFGKCGRKVGWNVKWYENMEEKSVEKWRDKENAEKK